MKREVVDSLPLLSRSHTLISYLSSTLVYLVPSLVCRVLPLVLPAHLVYRQLGTSRVQTNPTALASRNVTRLT